MELSDDGAAFTAKWEGTVKRNGLHVLYEDSLGHTTVGIGHLVHLGPIDGSEPDEFKRGLTDDEAWELFRADAAVYVEAVDRLVTVELTQRQFDAIVDFAFNWGIGEVGGFPATSVLKLINDEDWEGVAEELVNGRGPVTDAYPYGRPYDKGLPGVRARRIAEAEAFKVPRMSNVDIVWAVIADLEAAGIPVQQISGWENRGRPYAFNPRGAVDHHTATKGYAYDYPSLGIVRDGRSDLPGPLSNFGIGRHTGTVYVISAGFCNHAGGGGWNGLRGNGSVWGASEAENDGIGEPVGPEQMKARLHLHAALCRHTGYGPEMIACHREWSDGGKIDPTGVDGDWLRSAVAELLENPPTPEPEPEEPEVAKIAYPLTIRSGEHRRLPVPVVAGGLGWTKSNVTYAASSPVNVKSAKVGPYHERQIDGLSGQNSWTGRSYIELRDGDEWVEIELASSPAGTLELLVEAADG